MNPSLLFLLGLAITLGMSFAVVMYLRSSLLKILVELCGTEERAAFWSAFSTVTVTLAPAMFALQYRPNAVISQGIVLELANQLKWGLAGLVISVVLLGWSVGRFIARATPGVIGTGLSRANPRPHP